MRKLIVLFTVIFCLTMNAQKIGTSNMVHDIAGEMRMIYLKDFKTPNPLLYQFGDGNEMLAKDGSTPADRIVKHTYKEPGNYVVKVYELKDNQQNLITAENIVINPPPSELIINQVIVKKYKSTKPDGRAWDNMMGGTYPDIYVSYSSGNVVLQESYVVSDVNPAKLPVTIDRDRHFDLSKISGNLTIYFKDFDSVSGHDRMAGFTVNLDPVYLLDNMKEGIVFKFNGFEGFIKYRIK